MIAVVDYGMGNLHSVQKAFERLGHSAEITRDVGAIMRADGVVLPGVGAFSACMENLKRYDLVAPMRDVVARKTPFLGICLGFQLLFSESEEFGPQKGLDIFPGRVVGFRPGNGTKVPHMGWNQLETKKSTPFLDSVSDGDFVYFVHSFYVVPEDPSLVATTTPYSPSFASSIATDHLFACQFHPEKSQTVGLKILGNFARFAEKK
ncbi:MAG TPA: imidazole glycerol phosphate synthase subunit HisH [Candidatus Binatia bacterium]|nr:imidazole glycerol phosphate synthase subunit HisH [Candidatus Binatia bacterium]